MRIFKTKEFARLRVVRAFPIKGFVRLPSGRSVAWWMPTLAAA